MGQVLHSSATTTQTVRRAIQNSQESLRTLAKRYGINQRLNRTGFVGDFYLSNCKACITGSHELNSFIIFLAGIIMRFYQSFIRII